MNSPYRTLLIDDESPARVRLGMLLKEHEDVFDVIGEAANGVEGLEMVVSLKPDLIFLGVQMPGMTGFEMLQQLEEIPIVVFCTAYDTYSLEAFETNSLDYLVKPVRKERLAKTVDKLRFFKKENSTEHLLGLLQKINDSTVQAKKPTSVTVRSGKKITFVRLEDIAYFKAKDKYVSLFTMKGKEHLMDLSLVQLEAQLTDMFLRVHRSIIVNTDKVLELQPYFNSRYAIVMADQHNTKIISGRSYGPHLK
ncbi:LytR/AlgR family response regulator transcription factor [Flagellimonas onchidii]|uniref:LytR/AlgR family response regulator transcription factor n=1 Tax=Flagellimonas onchidii TaxID=2562684 RepID=UPI0010A63D95|nr:LytTR family DNA-binding domain-containing protein [Allomuricauda onchidii]